MKSKARKPRTISKRVKAWAVCLPNGHITTQINWEHIDQPQQKPDYWYYIEVFNRRGEAAKRQKIIKEPINCKVIPVTITYSLPKVAKKNKRV